MEKSLLGLNENEVKEIFAEVKSTYTLVVKREDETLTFDLNIIKNKIDNVITKIYEQNEKKIGYIKLSIFSFDSAKEFKSEFRELQNKNIDSLIIDLRDNPGGEERNLIKIASLFLDKDKVIFNQQFRNKNKIIYSKGNSTFELPIVLLGNKSTASCSEIFIASVLEGCNATFIGTTTRGKGVGQKAKITANYYYKFTVDSWTTPSGKSINGIGIVPDIEVHNNENEDLQLEKAKEYLSSI